MSKLYGPQDKSGLNIGKFDTSTPETDDIDRQLGHLPPLDERSLARKSGDLAKNTGLALTSLTSGTIIYLTKGALKTIGLTFAVAVGGFAALQANEAVNGATSYEAPRINNDTDVKLQQHKVPEPPAHT